MKRLALLGALLAPVPSSAYQETLRHGYPSCGACHVAIQGGGVLSGYGKSVSGEALSTFESSGGVVPAASWLDVGADYRMANVNVRAGGETLHQKIPMQTEIEAAAHPVEGATVAASVGVYGPKAEQQYRRAYVMFQPTSWLMARSGRFPRTFGINQVDHTAWIRTRAGYGEGSERFGSELGLFGKHGELVIGHFVGAELDGQARARGVEMKNAEIEHVARGLVYLGAHFRAGASIGYHGGELHATGYQLEWAPRHWLYYSAELVRARGELLGDTKVTFEPWRGVLPFLGAESAPQQTRYRVGLQWLVTRGLELTGHYRATYDRGRRAADEYTAVLHAYL